MVLSSLWCLPTLSRHVHAPRGKEQCVGVPGSPLLSLINHLLSPDVWAHRLAELPAWL